MDRPLELSDFEYIGDDWHYDAPIRGYILPTSKGGQGKKKILVIDDLFDMIHTSRKKFLSGGRVGYFNGGLSSLYNILS